MNTIIAINVARQVMMGSLKIASNNVRGMGNDQKRREIFHFLHVRNFDTVLLQESHSAKHLQKRWRSEWGGKTFFLNGTTQARGVIILIAKNINITVQFVIKDTNGRFIALDVTYGQTRFMVSNIYAPNLDNPGFFMNIFN